MKKGVYIFLWIILGIIFSFILHAILEMAEIKYAFAQGLIPYNITFLGLCGYCALPVGAQVALLIFGVVVGIWAGLYFWKKLYTKSGKLKKK